MIFNRWCSARSLFTGGSSAHLCLLNFYNLWNIGASAEYQSSHWDTTLVFEPLIRSHCHRLHAILTFKKTRWHYMFMTWRSCVEAERMLVELQARRLTTLATFYGDVGTNSEYFLDLFGCDCGDQNRYFYSKHHPFLILTKLLLFLNLTRPQAWSRHKITFKNHTTRNVKLQH